MVDLTGTYLMQLCLSLRSAYSLVTRFRSACRHVNPHQPVTSVHILKEKLILFSFSSEFVNFHSKFFSIWVSCSFLSLFSLIFTMKILICRRQSLYSQSHARKKSSCQIAISPIVMTNMMLADIFHWTWTFKILSLSLFQECQIFGQPIFILFLSHYLLLQRARKGLGTMLQDFVQRTAQPCVYRW